MFDKVENKLKDLESKIDMIIRFINKDKFIYKCSDIDQEAVYFVFDTRVHFKTQWENNPDQEFINTKNVIEITDDLQHSSLVLKDWGYEDI